MPANSHRIPSSQINPGPSRNATNNALAVLRATITLRITVIPAVIESLGYAAARSVQSSNPYRLPAQGHEIPLGLNVSRSTPAAQTAPAMLPEFNQYTTVKKILASQLFHFSKFNLQDRT